MNLCNRLRSNNSAYTLIEVLIVVSLLALVLTNTYPAMRDSRNRAINAHAEAAVTSLNTAAYRITVESPQDASNPVLAGNDKQAALAYYVDHGYLANGDKINLTYVEFLSGVWIKNPVY